MKKRFTQVLRKNVLQRLTRTFLMKVHRRLDAYFVQDETILLKHIDRHRSWQIGEYSYGHPYKSPKVVHFGENVQLRIGNFCSFAEDVWILLGGGHRTDWVTTYPFSILFEGGDQFKGLPYTKGDIVIGNDVWVCTGATILSGVTVGDGAVVAAKSVVTKDVPPYAVVAGNPARVVKMRFSDEQIESLKRIQWWDWPVEKIQAEFPLLLSQDIQGFVDKHDHLAQNNDSAREH